MERGYPRKETEKKHFGMVWKTLADGGYARCRLRWNSHLKVTAAFWAVNILWLLPLAYFSLQNRQLGPLLTAVAYLPLLVIASLSGAGSKEPEKTQAPD